MLGFFAVYLAGLLPRSKEASPPSDRASSVVDPELLRAFEAIESMRRQLSAELGRHGVRFVTLRTGGVPETIPAGMEGREPIVAEIERLTMLGRAATLEDVGDVAAFVASDHATAMTATGVNLTCGHVPTR